MIDHNLLTYVCPLPLVPHKFINVNNYKIRVFDYDQQIFLQKDCQVDFKENGVIDGKQSSDSFTQYFPVYCNGRIFIQVRNCVYEIVGDMVVFIDKIPNFNMSTSGYFYGKLFSQSNVLYAVDTEGALYYLDNREVFKYIRPCKYGYYFSFCGQTVVWYIYDGVYKLPNDFGMIEYKSESLELICKTCDEMIYVCGNIGGILVLHVETCEQVLMLDILTYKHVIVKEKTLHVLQIGSHVTLKSQGLSLDDYYIEKYFDKTTSPLHLEKFAIFFQEQQKLPGFRKAEFDSLKSKILTVTRLQQKMNCKITELPEILEQKAEKRYEMIENKLEKIAEQIELVQKQQQMLIQCLQGLLGTGNE
ncbi:Conserved_hypothetical protein [Hexamita inflata]|uniref:Uncharacterized protein n=1 Tax=Hexamita inflata TaxID=28002 RepID=A0AA86TIN6_9EUKA|nr:Conserved hypothetical protein [Hexamita inflata]